VPLVSLGWVFVGDGGKGAFFFTFEQFLLNCVADGWSKIAFNDLKLLDYCSTASGGLGFGQEVRHGV